MKASSLLPLTGALLGAFAMISCQGWSTVYHGNWNPREVGYVSADGGSSTKLIGGLTPEAMQFDHKRKELVVDGFSNIVTYDLKGNQIANLVPGADVLKMAIDVKNGHLYFTARKPGNPSKSRVERCDLGTGTNRVTLVDNVPFGSAIAVDLKHGWLYWWQEGAIHRAHLDGSGAHRIHLAWGTALAVDASRSRLYWARRSFPGTYDGQIWTANLDGSDAKLLVQTEAWVLEDLALDGARKRLYWIERKSGQTNIKSAIRCCDLDGET